MFQEVAARYDGPTLEKDVLAFWRREQVFQKTLEHTHGRPPFVFYEGPPTANGRPGIHHVLARTFKDLYPRYKTMRGFHCDRKAGWDCHGLPVEHEVEKSLQIFDKREIEKRIGIAEFVRLCRESVMRYVGDWEAMTERMGFWVDLEHAYLTLDNSYIESVWSLLKTLWDRGLIYQGYKVVPYDPRIGATLSSHEVAQGYREVEDPSAYVRFAVSGEPNTYFLVWTTTPWTLPANLLLAVHPDLDYVRVRRGEETLILARYRLSVLGDDNWTEISRMHGRDLEGVRYDRLFDYLPDAPGSCVVRTAEFVSAEDGTGIVHIAPAYGADDLKLGQLHGLPVLHAVGDDGYFLPSVTPVAGMFFKQADPVILDLLRERGLLFRVEPYLHSYPFGWRTGDPLIYYAKNAWYIRTTAVRERMMELNQTIHWVPENIRDGRFGNWLEGNVDWALSRERFWGTPLPVWTDGEGDYLCIGSLQELEQRAGRKLEGLDLHRPAVDAITFLHEGREYRRVAEVIDCWFDSGSMPYAQLHYPFENDEYFRKHFPADFIAEAIDQTRGWFYTLHAIATMVCDSVAYRHVICLSHLVDHEGRKMSKSLGNVLDPNDVFDRAGADPLRWHFAARVAPDAQKRVSVDIINDVASSFINTLWNVYSFLVLYARLDKIDFNDRPAYSRRSESDRWVLALLEETVATATTALDNYDALRAGTAVERFVDQLSNWYVRLNRRRFWKATGGDDKQAAYVTLYECLDTVTRLIAPYMPFLSEALYQNLVRALDAGAPLSVHMARWPERRPERLDRPLLDEIAIVQQVVALGRSARNDSRLKVRQPLSRIMVRVPGPAAAQAIKRHAEQIQDELNVKAIELIAQDAKLVTYRLKPNLPVVGKRYGKWIPALRKALAEADGASIVATLAQGRTVQFVLDGETVDLGSDALLVETSAAEGFAFAEAAGYLVALDTHLTQELILEGLAREVVRTVQEARKQAGLNVSDRIVLWVQGDDNIVAALERHRDTVMNETLAVEWGALPAADAFSSEHSLNDTKWTIRLKTALD